MNPEFVNSLKVITIVTLFILCSCDFPKEFDEIELIEYDWQSWNDTCRLNLIEYATVDYMGNYKGLSGGNSCKKPCFKQFKINKVVLNPLKQAISNLYKDSVCVDAINGYPHIKFIVHKGSHEYYLTVFEDRVNSNAFICFKHQLDTLKQNTESLPMNTKELLIKRNKLIMKMSSDKSKELPFLFSPCKFPCSFKMDTTYEISMIRKERQ